MRLILGDCLEEMAALEAESVDAVVTDPPYSLSFMGRSWDTGIQHGPWAEAALRLLKPAHYLVAFGGTRTHHRLMVALEDAGFEIRDCLMWLYGSGFPKGRCNLKPAYEPIVLARRPGAKVRELGIDECRIGSIDESYIRNCSGDRGHADNRTRASAFTMTAGKASDIGRWPANVLLDEQAAELLDEQSGELVSGANPTRRAGLGYHGASGQQDCDPSRGQDVGGASRFFYCAKASREERNQGCDSLPRRMIRWSSGDQSPGTFQSDGTDKYARNYHPTVKPVDLMRWLVRLITPPGGTVLDPFMGSGTTGVACAEEQRYFVGIEREPEYMAIAEARIAAATAQLRLEV